MQPVGKKAITLLAAINGIGLVVGGMLLALLAQRALGTAALVVGGIVVMGGIGLVIAAYIVRRTAPTSDDDSGDE